MAYNASQHSYTHGAEVHLPNIRLICGDSTKINDVRASIVYTDPPWNDAILQKFYSLGGIPGRNWTQIITDLAYHLTFVAPTHLYVEMGLRLNSAAIAIFSKQGFVLSKTILCTYGATKTPFALNVFSNSPVPAPFHDIPGTQSFLTTLLTKDDTLYDPCAGEGNFLVPGISIGCAIIGCEMIPDKFYSMVRKITRLSLRGKNG